MRDSIKLFSAALHEIDSNILMLLLAPLLGLVAVVGLKLGSNAGAGLTKFLTFVVYASSAVVAVTLLAWTFIGLAFYGESNRGGGSAIDPKIFFPLILGSVIFATIAFAVHQRSGDQVSNDPSLALFLPVVATALSCVIVTIHLATTTLAWNRKATEHHKEAPK